MKNIAMKLMFDGYRYHGWQVQKDLMTVAGTIEAALSRLCGHIVKIHGCGRTDAGVHALVYCANFFTESSIPPERLPLAANSLLPPDISVLEAAYAPDGFDANLSCEKKEYTYKIHNSRIRDPFYYGRAYAYPKHMDIPAMRRAASHFVGTHDFAAVRSVGTETKTTVRTVYWYEIDEEGNTDRHSSASGGNEPQPGAAAAGRKFFGMRVCASGFLYNMARAMAGTLLYVSEGKIRSDDIPALLENKDRRLAGPTVPPGGLYLTRLWYKDDIGEMFT